MCHENTDQDRSHSYRFLIEKEIQEILVRVNHSLQENS